MCYTSLKEKRPFESVTELIIGGKTGITVTIKEYQDKINFSSQYLRTVLDITVSYILLCLLQAA